MKRFGIFFSALLVALLVALPGVAAADDWVAVKLRGLVFVQLDGAWVPLKRGDIVSDDRVIRTLASGRVTFERDAEMIDVLGGTEIQIVDQKGPRYTTVMQAYGTVSIEAEVQNVKHFEVRTVTMAAVVKGTRFTVVSDAGGTDVSVDRGRVWVECLYSHFTSVVAVGQEAANGHGNLLHAVGRTNLPVIYDTRGKPVTSAQ